MCITTSFSPSFTFTSFSHRGYLSNGFGSLVMYYECLYEKSSNVNGTYKILLLKFSVGLIVIQGLIEEFLFATGYVKLSNSKSFTSAERAQRFYCLTVLIEYAILSIAVYYAYSTEIRPQSSDENNLNGGDVDVANGTIVTTQVTNNNISNSNSGTLEVTASDSASIGSSSFSANTDLELADVGFMEYIQMIFELKDVLNDLEYNEGDSMRSPLVGNDSTNYSEGGNVV